MPTPARFPVDWLEQSATAAATDLDLAVLLVNSFDLLDDPPDRLHDLAWLTSAFAQVGCADLAAELVDDDLPGLRRLRDVLRVAFEAPDAHTAAVAINAQLREADAVFLLAPDGETGMRFTAGVEQTGYDALATRLPAALALHIAEAGIGRLGTCHSDPCRCAFVDRTRAVTRRYCCTFCNDRQAARAYRRRKQPRSEDAT